MDEVSNVFIGQSINGETIRGLTFYFSSKPPEDVIKALARINVLVDWAH